MKPILKEFIKSEIFGFDYKPLISIIMPTYNVDPKWLKLAINSVNKQWYKNWELCIADDCSTNKATVDYLKSIINNKKIKIKFLNTNLNISEASNEALSLASGEYICLLDNDDELTPDALYEVVKCINMTGAEFIYSDEDKIDIKGNCEQAYFKPDYSPDFHLSNNYICHFSVIKKYLVEDVNGFSKGFDGAQDYDLFLKVLENTEKVEHITKILYHWRTIPGSTASEFSNKDYANIAGKKALESAIRRRKLNASVITGKYPGTYRVKYEIVTNPLISIIIPFKDKIDLLDQCIKSILQKTTYQNYEIICISNNSLEDKTFEHMKGNKKFDYRLKFYEYNIPFNYSKINNYAVNNLVKGEQILLLNNDTEIINNEWLSSLLEFSQQPSVGAVGGMLLYRDNTIQHAGVILGIGGVGVHSHKGINVEAPGYFTRPHLVQNITAVTGACLMVKTSLYNIVNGLDEKKLKIAFNDVDFCLKLIEKGYKNIYTPYCKLYHYESISRGHENLDSIRFREENNYMLNKYKDKLNKGDSYYNPNLTIEREDFSLK